MEAIRFEAKDVPLRNDVNALGTLLGEVLQEQGDDALFSRVEAARHQARLRRKGDKNAEASLCQLLTDLPPDTSTEIIRAFSAYFALVNIAERVHRIRRRRAYLRADAAPQPSSVRAIVQKLRENNVPSETLVGWLQNMRITPVFTAHPTEAIRRTLLLKAQDVAKALIQRLPDDRLPEEEKAAWNAIRQATTSGWQTAEHLSTRPSVADEVEHVLFYLRDVIYDVLPKFYADLESAVAHAYGDKVAKQLPQAGLLQFASWVGGDMDGNPNVTADTIRDTLARQQTLIVERYIDETRDLAVALSQSTTRIGIDQAVLERVATYQRDMPHIAATIPTRYQNMPYRMLLRFAQARLQGTLLGNSHAYPHCQAFVDDLECIARSLRNHSGQLAGLEAIEAFLQRVHTFGFHLATLDVRQDALVHRRVIGEIFGDDDFLERSAQTRTEQLLNALEQPAALEPPSSVAPTLEVFRSIAAAQANKGKDAIGLYIISMAQDADDALAPLFLARTAGLQDPEGHIPLDIAPLFETVPDLQHAADILTRLLQNPLYRDHVRARGDRQWVMLGYSDSSKESGLAASRWALQRAQTQLAEAAAAFGIELTLFHGRGGSLSRGGTKPRNAILATPSQALAGRLRVTEQGEIIDAKYGLHDIALRTLELMGGAVLENISHRQHRQRDLDRSWLPIMEKIAQTSRNTYRALIYENPAFLAYFQQATPIDVITRMHIGSRPPSRRAQQGVQDLRAIPWVFSWVQNRHILPAWYGLGAGLKEALKEHGVATLRDMTQHWPFFNNLIADAEMVLAKADMPIAKHYAALAGDTGKPVFEKIKAAFEGTKASICRIQDVDELLDRDPVLQRSIRLRNPYVDPMSLLQVDLLKRWRDSGREDAELEAALFSSVKGIARGMQNTG